MQQTPLLAGLRVVELACSLRAAYCAKLLAEWGADVIKVEPAVPEREAEAGERAWLDAGKRSVILDWRAPEGAALLRRLCARSDVLVEDQPPGSLAEAGMAPEAFSREQPRLVHTTITDFGSDGPWADRASSDLIVSALSGLCLINGNLGRLPLREPGNQTQLAAALMGYIGTLSALAHRSVSGRGQHVDVSALESVVSIITPSVLQFSQHGIAHPRRAAEKSYLFRCKDGWVSMQVAAERGWETLMAAWRIEVDPDDPHLSTVAGRRQHNDAIRTLLAPALAARTRQEIFLDTAAMRVITGMVMAPAELPADPHLTERGSFVRVAPQSPGEPERPLPGPGFRIAGQPPRSPRRGPERGEHTGDVMRDT